MAYYREVLLATLALSAVAWAVKTGDEQFTYEEGGLYYVFGDQAIFVIDPSDMRVVKTIVEDQDGEPLVNGKGTTRTWMDGVYAESPETDGHYIVINEGDVYGEGDDTWSYVTVVDTVAQEVVARVKVDPNPVHLYSIPSLGEIWTHSDELATFNIIHLSNLSADAEHVPASLRIAAHGKLLWDHTLFPLAYATNVFEQYVFEIDLMQRELKNTYSYAEDLTEPAQCIGFHGIQYSRVNQHLYLECVAGGGILEWDTVSKSAVFQWENSTGSMVALPFDNYVIAANKLGNKAHVFAPQGNGEMSSHRYHVNVPGNPAGTEYLPNKLFVDEAGGNDTIHDYVVYFPLSRNTNKYNIEAAGELGMDVTNVSYSTMPADCKYNMSDHSATHADVMCAALRL